MHSVGVGLLVLVVMGGGEGEMEVELVGGRAAEIRVEKLVMEASGETVAIMASFELAGGNVVSVTDETKVTQLVALTEVESSPASVSKWVVVDKPKGIFDLLVEGEEVVVMTEAASPAASAASAASS